MVNRPDEQQYERISLHRLIKVAANYYFPQQWFFTNDLDYLSEATTKNKILVTHHSHITGVS